MIVAHEVTNIGRRSFAADLDVEVSADALGKKRLTVLADRGYFNGKEILQCERAGATPLVPKPLTSGSKAGGRFDKRDFV